MSTLASIFTGISGATWVDIVCAVFVAIFVIHDARRGLSAMIAQITSLVIAFKFAFLLHPFIAAQISGDGFANAIAVFAVTIIVAFAIFIILKFIFAKIAHVFLISPLDQILGGLAGAIKSLLLLFIVYFAITSVMGESFNDTVFAKSKTGRNVMPIIAKLMAPAAKLPGALGGR